MSKEGFDFTPGANPKFPKLIMRAFTGPDKFVEWVFTPPNDGGMFTYAFEAEQKEGILYVNFDERIMMPKA